MNVKYNIRTFHSNLGLGELYKQKKSIKNTKKWKRNQTQQIHKIKWISKRTTKTLRFLKINYEKDNKLWK